MIKIFVNYPDLVFGFLSVSMHNLGRLKILLNSRQKSFHLILGKLGKHSKMSTKKN
jgi:hypothetical protein